MPPRYSSEDSKHFVVESIRLICLQRNPKHRLQWIPDLILEYSRKTITVLARVIRVKNIVSHLEKRNNFGLE